MIDIRFTELTIVAGSARRTIAFSAGLNVVVGPYGSGKSSLLELLKFGLGGSSVLSDTVQSFVSTVIVTAELAGRRLSFERDIGSQRVRVSQFGDLLLELHATSTTTRNAQLASHFLLTTLAVPALRVRRSQRSTETEPISFWDIYRFAYVSQDDMGQSIAGFSDSQLKRKRKRAFELMFGFIGEELAQTEAVESAMQQRLNEEETRLDAVTDFLNGANVPSQGFITSRLLQRQAEQEELSSQLGALRRSSIERTSDASPLRARLQEARNAIASIEHSIRQVEIELNERQLLQAQIQSEIEQIRRSSLSIQVFEGLDFDRCPRCMQGLDAARYDDVHCYLCGLKVDVSVDALSGTAEEIDRRESVLSELAELATDDRVALAALQSRATDLRVQIGELETALGERTDSFVSPLFEEMQHLSSRLAQAEAEERSLEAQLNQWRHRSEIQEVVQSLRRELQDIAEQLEVERRRLESARFLVDEFSATFDEIVSALEVQWYESASIRPDNYMPEVNGADFRSLSGGQRTVVSIAFHLALLTIGLVYRQETLIPSLLILDSPSKYLGGRDVAQVERNYRRISAIVGAYDYPMQVIVADNASPPPGAPVSNIINLSYEDPLVPGVAHPGGDSVLPIFDRVEGDDEP